MNKNSIIIKQFTLPNGKIDKKKFLRTYYKLKYRFKQIEEFMIDIEANKDLFKTALMLGFRDLYPPLHKEVCELITNQKYKKKLILLPRGHFKTSVGNIAYSIFRIIQNPNIKILIYSGLREKAKGMLAPIRNILSNHTRFLRRFGSYKGNRIWNKSEILVRQAEQNQIDNTYTIETSGVDEAVTSKHFDLIIFDDIVTRKNVKELSQRMKVKEAFDEAVDSLLKPNGEVVILGTIWHFDDLYVEIMEKNNIKNGGEYVVYKRSAWEGFKDIDNIWETGHAIMPTIYTKEMLQQKEKKNEYLFWCNWMNIPRVNKNKPLNYQMLGYYEKEKIDINELKNVEIIMDPASGKENKWNDSAAYIVAGKLGNKIIVLDMFKDKIDTQEICEKVFMVAKKFRMAKFIHIEDAAEQNHLINYAKKELARWKAEKRIHDDVYILEDIKPQNRNKEQRIAQLKPFIQDKTILYPYSIMHETKEFGKTDIMRMLKIEMDQFPLGDHDDLLDVNSYLLDVFGMEIEDYVNFSLDKSKNNEYNSQRDRYNRFYEFSEDNDDSSENEIFDRDIEEIIEI